MKEKLKRKLKMWAVSGVLILAAGVGVSKTVSVSNTVNGKELPIYSVETDEKKVALSFDAAWGDGNSGYIKCKEYERKAIATVDKKYKEL